MENIEICVAEQAKDIEYMKDKLDSIETKLDNFISSADQKYARSEEFLFWRNVLICGVLITIFVSIILEFIKR